MRAAAISVNPIDPEALKRESPSLRREPMLTCSLFQTPDMAAQDRLFNEVAALAGSGLR